MKKIRLSNKGRDALRQLLMFRMAPPANSPFGVARIDRHYFKRAWEVLNLSKVESLEVADLVEFDVPDLIVSFIVGALTYVTWAPMGSVETVMEVEGVCEAFGMETPPTLTPEEQAEILKTKVASQAEQAA